MRSKRILANSCFQTSSETSTGSVARASSKPNVATLRASVSTSCAPSGIRVRPLFDDPEAQEQLQTIRDLSLDRIRFRPVCYGEPVHELREGRREVQAFPDGGRAAGQFVDLLITRPRHDHVRADTPMQRIGGRPEPGAVREPHSRTTFGAGLDPKAFRASNTSFACSETQSRSYALCGVSSAIRSARAMATVVSSVR